MENHARHIKIVNLQFALSQDRHGTLFDELLAAFDTACALSKPGIAEPLLLCMEDALGGDDMTAGLGLSRLERLVEARYRLLEVRYGMRIGGSPFG